MQKPLAAKDLLGAVASAARRSRSVVISGAQASGFPASPLHRAGFERASVRPGSPPLYTIVTAFGGIALMLAGSSCFAKHSIARPDACHHGRQRGAYFRVMTAIIPDWSVASMTLAALPIHRRSWPLGRSAGGTGGDALFALASVVCSDRKHAA